MASTILLRSSANTGETPDVVSLGLGELCLNTGDGFLYFKTPAGLLYQLQATLMAYSFSTVNVNGTLLVATQNATTLMLTADETVQLTTDATNNAVQLSLTSLVENIILASYAQANAAYDQANLAPTEIYAVKPTTTACTSSTTLTADANLTLTFTETGFWAIELFMSFHEAASGAGGFKFDIGGGSLTPANLYYQVTGYGTAAIPNAAAITSDTTVTSVTPITTSTTAPSWVMASGVVNVTTPGTWSVRWAQNASNASAVSLHLGSYFKATLLT